MLNRELSRLDFNARVLAQAADPEVPLLERVRFCSIVSSNLDEFFMVRVAGLQRQAGAGVATRSADGRTPGAVLSDIRQRVSGHLRRSRRRCGADELTPIWPNERHRGVSLDDCTEDELDELTNRFEGEIFPVLTPLAVGPGQPFPYISGPVDEPGRASSASRRTARSGSPGSRCRRCCRASCRWRRTAGWCRSRSRSIAHFLSWLFPGMEVVEHVVFRVTRDADFELSGRGRRPAGGGRAGAAAAAVRRRRPARGVRRPPAPPAAAAERRPGRVGRPGVRRSTACSIWPTSTQIADLDRPDLRYEPWIPVTRPRLAASHRPRGHVRADPRGDLLVHLPYDSFATRSRLFVRTAARTRGGRDQDHRVPHPRRLGAAAVADRRGRAGEADRVPGRAEGPLRRAPQHRVVARDGAGRGARRATASPTSRSTPRRR